MRMASSVGISHREAVGNLANGVGIRVSLTLAIESKMMVTSVSSITSVSGVTDSSDDSNIMRMASSVGIGHRESVSNLANSVGIRVSFTLAIVTSVATIETSITSIATVTNGSISRDKAMAVINSSDTTKGMSSSNLTNCVGIRITVSFTLAIEAVMDTSIASIATIVATVTDSSISRDKAMAIVNSSNDTMAITMGHLSYGVRLTVCQGSTCQDNTKEESHHAVFYGDTLTTTPMY